MIMEEKIQFIATCKDWQVIKKLNIDDRVPPIDKMDLLASVAISFDSKLFQYLGDIVDIKVLEDFAKEIASGKIKKEEDFARMLKDVTSVKAAKVINSLIPDKTDNKSKEKLKQYMKVFLLRKIMREGKLFADYTQVPIQANKGKK